MTAETESEEKAPAGVVRGIARVGPDSVPSARGVAVVPGALSVPRPAPSLWRSISPPTILFETLPDEEPAVRPPAPGAKPVEKTQPDGTPVDGSPPVPERRLLRRAALPAVSAVLAALVVGTTYLALADQAVPIDPDLGRWGASATPAQTEAIEGAGNAGRPPGDPFGNVITAGQGAPTRVRVPAIGLDSPLETLHIAAGGALQAPRGFEHAGWYADGTAPGDVGPAVLAGHVDSKAGPAVFYRLRELTAGDKIEVVRGGRVLRFTITRTAWYPKNKFPSAEVYGPTPDRQLRLITCGGVFDHRLRSYKDNLVVYAVAG